VYYVGHVNLVVLTYDVKYPCYLHIWLYLVKVIETKPPNHPAFSPERFSTYDWEDFYKGAFEEIPDNIPEPRGTPVNIHCFVDDNHAANKITCKSHT
jgi:hypothetical protein